jgi:hypothetical protein
VALVRSTRRNIPEDTILHLNTRLLPRYVTRKYALKIVVKNEEV